MAKGLPSRKDSDKKLQKISDAHSKKFYDYLEANSISPNSSRDIAFLANNELNSRLSNRTFYLTCFVILISLITLFFGLADYKGDIDWQKEQIKELQNINSNLNERNSQIESLKLELFKSKEQIMLLEKRIKLYEKKVEPKKK